MLLTWKGSTAPTTPAPVAAIYFVARDDRGGPGIWRKRRCGARRQALYSILNKPEVDPIGTGGQHAEIEERLMAIAHSGAGWVMWLLIALSIAGLSVVLDRAIVLFGSRDDVERLKSICSRCSKEGKWTPHVLIVGVTVGTEAKVVVAGLCRSRTVGPRRPRNAWPARPNSRAWQWKSGSVCWGPSEVTRRSSGSRHRNRHHRRVNALRKAGGKCLLA